MQDCGGLVLSYSLCQLLVQSARPSSFLSKNRPGRSRSSGGAESHSSPYSSFASSVYIGFSPRSPLIPLLQPVSSAFYLPPLLRFRTAWLNACPTPPCFSPFLAASTSSVMPRSTRPSLVVELTIDFRRNSHPLTNSSPSHSVFLLPSPCPTSSTPPTAWPAPCVPPSRACRWPSIRASAPWLTASALSVLRSERQVLVLEFLPTGGSHSVVLSAPVPPERVVAATAEFRAAVGVLAQTTPGMFPSHYAAYRRSLGDLIAVAARWPGRV